MSSAPADTLTAKQVTELAHKTTTTTITTITIYLCLACNRYLNDELEPIYQWIPELNKRVYSDKYERYIDKSYAVSDDVDFMLGAYRLLENANPPQAALAKTNSRKLSDQLSPLAQEIAGDDPSPYERRALAERLDALARLGGVRARQLIGQVRAALALEQYPDSSSASVASYSSPLSSASASKEQQVNDDAANNNNYEQLLSTPDAFKSFRAIRLVRPTSELSGRYTCSVSSLDSDAIASTRLLVYGKYWERKKSKRRSANQLAQPSTCCSSKPERSFSQRASEQLR